jgi:hexosaminidase
MIKQILPRLVSLAVLAAMAGSGVVAYCAAAEPNLVPWPQSVKLAQGSLPLSAKSRIVCRQAELQPLGSILADEIRQISGLKLAVLGGTPRRGDIVLSIDSSLAKEAYRLAVTDRASVQGGNYGAVALGTATLLQALAVNKQAASIPRMTVDDAPKSDFRGLMVDVARQQHSIASLKDIVTLCRFYKVRYLQLHLTDDQAFMFPSRAYPLLNTKNDHGRKSYTIEELKDLVAFADRRNVTIIPEYEVPGHSAAANRAMHDLFIIAKTKPYEHHASINFCKDDVMRAVETVTGEMCEVFKSSPYFHIGGDEADLALANQNVDFKAAMKKYDLPNQHELYRRFVCQMDEIVKKHGKQMIVWEGFGRRGKVPIPTDIIVMAYEIRFYMPGDLVDDGYKVINASWTPLYVVNKNCRPPEEIYAWNLYQFKPYGAKPEAPGRIVPPSENVIGAEMCAWEQKESQEMPSLRERLPTMIERIWNPAANKAFENFNRRLSACDGRFDLMIKPAN